MLAQDLDFESSTESLSPSQRAAIAFFLRSESTDRFAAHESWVLRNLTAREFVRGDAVFAAFPRSERKRGPYLGGYPDFGDIVAVRASCLCGQWAEGCYHGPWAGHRFEICPEEHHRLDLNDWRDVTPEVILEWKPAGHAE